MKGMMLCVAATFFFRKPLKAYVTVSPAKVEAPPLRLKCILAPSSHLQQRKRPKVNISTCCSLLQDILNYLDSNGPRSSSTSIIKTENTVQRPSKHHLFLMETEAELDKLTKTMKAFQPTPPPRTVNSHCLKVTQNVSLWLFRPIFVRLKLTYLSLFDCKL